MPAQIIEYIDIPGPDEGDRDLALDIASQGARLTAVEAHNPEAWLDARAHADGLVSVMDSGQPLTIYGSAEPLIFSSGKIVYSPGVSGSRAGYMTAALKGPVTRAGMTFSFLGGSTFGGAAVMVLPKVQYAFGVDVAAHFIIGPTIWTYQVRTAPGSFVTVYTGTFEPPLATDGTEYSVELQRDGANVNVLLPDNTIWPINDAAIAANAAQFVTWEPYQYDVTTDDVPRIHEVWADSGAPTRRAVAPTLDQQRKVLARYQPKVTTSYYAPATEGVISLVSGRTELNSALRQTVQMPPSGMVLLELTCWIAAVAGQVAVGISSESDLSGGVFARAWDGTTPSILAVTMIERFGGIPGAKYTFRAWARLQGGTSGEVRMWSSGRPAILKVTPL